VRNLKSRVPMGRGSGRVFGDPMSSLTPDDWNNPLIFLDPPTSLCIDMHVSGRCFSTLADCSRQDTAGKSHKGLLCEASDCNVACINIGSVGYITPCFLRRFKVRFFAARAFFFRLTLGFS